MSDGAHEKVKLNVRVPPSKKREWKDAVAEGQTLSSLVRRAVDREIRDEYIPKDAIEDVEVSNKSNIDLSIITDRFDEMQQTLNSLETKVDTLSVGEMVDEEDIEDLAMDLLPRLPSYPHDVPKEAAPAKGDTDPQEFIKLVIRGSRETTSPDGPPVLDGSAQRLSREIREPTPKVREALIHLESNTTEKVRSTVIDGVRHWMRGV